MDVKRRRNSCSSMTDKGAWGNLGFEFPGVHSACTRVRPRTRRVELPMQSLTRAVIRKGLPNDQPENSSGYSVWSRACRRIAGGAEERVEVQALWFGELWRGVPPFAHEQAPPRTRRRQVRLVRVEVYRCRMPPQPDREACEVEAASRVRVACRLEVTTNVHGRRWNAAPTRNCASVSVARLRWSAVQNVAPKQTGAQGFYRRAAQWSAPAGSRGKRRADRG